MVVTVMVTEMRKKKKALEDEEIRWAGKVCYAGEAEEMVVHLALFIQ